MTATLIDDVVTLSPELTKELTFEEFLEQPLQYNWGMRFYSGAQRLYRSDKLRIQREVFTKFSQRTQKWGKAEVYFYQDNDPVEYRSSAELYMGWFMKNFPEPNLDTYVQIIRGSV